MATSEWDQSQQRAHRPPPHPYQQGHPEGFPPADGHLTGGHPAPAHPGEPYAGGPAGQQGHPAPAGGGQPYGYPPQGDQPHGAFPHGDQPYGYPPQGDQAYGNLPRGDQPYGSPTQGDQAYGYLPHEGAPPAGPPPSPAHPTPTGPPHGGPAHGHPAHGGPTHGVGQGLDDVTRPMPKVAAPQAAAVRPSGGAPGRHRLPGAPDAGATSHRQAADSPLVTAPPAAATATVSPPSPSAPPGAPARTGSPIIEPGIQPALITAGLCLLLGLTAGLSRPGLAVAAVLLQAVTAAGVFRLNGMWPARQGIALAFAGGLTADVVMLALDGEHAPAVAIGTLGVWFLLVLVLQLRHRGGPDERLYALTVTMTSATTTVLASGLVAAWSVGAQGSEGEEWATGAPVLIGVAAVGAAVLVRALPLPLAASVAASLAAATGAGAIAGGYVDVGAGGGALIALAVGCAALIGHRLASYDFPSRFVHFTAGVSLPLAVAAPVVYVMGRVVAG